MELGSGFSYKVTNTHTHRRLRTQTHTQTHGGVCSWFSFTDFKGERLPVSDSKDDRSLTHLEQHARTQASSLHVALFSGKKSIKND